MKLRETKDGSKTLHEQNLDVFYHSVHGALSETRHVYGEMGLLPALERCPKGLLHVLEVGFGTGLNVLDVWSRAKKAERHVVIHSLEPSPLSWEEVSSLDYAALTDVPEEIWRTMHEVGAWQDEWMTFERIETGLFEMDQVEQTYDLVMFDAFAPAAQPELWTTPAMDRMRLALKLGGQLVTYCAKGEVRRAMEEAGFLVRRIPGPPGKREMVRATKMLNRKGRFNVRVYMIVERDSQDGGKEVLVSYERLPMGGVMKFPGGGLEWGEGTSACLRREALEELGQPVDVGPLVHISQRVHLSSFDENHQVLAVHYRATLTSEVSFDDQGELEDVFGKRVPMMHQRLGWRLVKDLNANDFHFASDREAWRAWQNR